MAEETTAVAVVFQMLTSDSDGDGDSDGADTTLGSPPRAGGADEAWGEEGAGEESQGEVGEAREEARGDRDASSPESSVVASQQDELVLSPASQLHVLSQISELAEAREAKQREAQADAGQYRVVQQRHPWAPAAQRTLSLQHQPSAKRKLPSAPVTARKPRKMNTGIGSVIAAEITHWEAFDDPILAGDEDADAWSFEELSDSDF